MAGSAGGRTGVWLIGAMGGLGTTLIVGARALAGGLTSSSGLVTQRPELASLDLVALGDLTFGGHDVRSTTLRESAQEIHRETGSITHELLTALAPDLDA